MMPLLNYVTSIRTSNLRIKISHVLSTSCPAQFERNKSGADNTSKIYKTPVPKNIDILSHPSRLTVLLLGSVDGKPVSANQMCASGVGKHLLQCMRRNATFLGIHDISDLCLEDGIPSIFFSSSHPLPVTPASPFLTFLSLKLIYAWVTIPDADTEQRAVQDWHNVTPTSAAVDPITSSSMGPFATLLDRVVHRIFSYHMIRRYPLIFGPYSRAIRSDQVLFPAVAKSLSSIITRSKSLSMKDQSLACTKRLRIQNIRRNHVALRAVRKLLPCSDSCSDYESGSDPEEEFSETGNATGLFEDTLAHALTGMYTRHIKPWNRGLFVNTHADDNEQPTWLQNSVDCRGTQTDQDLTKKRPSTHETPFPRLPEAKILTDIDGQDYLLDLDWNSGQEEERSKEPDNEQFLRQDNSLLMHRSVSSVANSEREEGKHAAPDWNNDLDLDMDSDTEIVGVLNDQTSNNPEAHLYLPFYGAHSVSGSSADVESLSDCGFHLLLGEHEAGSSTRPGSQDTPYPSMDTKNDLIHCTYPNASLPSIDRLSAMDSDTLDMGYTTTKGEEAPLRPQPLLHRTSRDSVALSAACMPDGQMMPHVMDLEFDSDSECLSPCFSQDRR